MRVFGSIAALTCVIAVTPGCAGVGPPMIQAGCIEYNEVMAVTEAQQALPNVVRLRYGELPVALSVASITANARIHAETGINLGFGPEDTYAGNLVPFSGGFYYEENPVISYLPVQGAEHVRQLASPLPPEIAIALLRASQDQAATLDLLVSRINDLHNPEFVQPGAVPAEPGFARVVELMGGLARRGQLDWVRRPGTAVEFAIVISAYAPEHLDEVHELLLLLGDSRPADSGRTVLDVSLAIGERAPGSVNIMTRSVHDLAVMLAAATEVATEDERSGRAVTFPPLARPGAALRIGRTESPPKDAAVAVRHKGYWYYVADTDLMSKRVFYMVQGIWSTMIAEAAGQAQAPVLTIPVSK